jgi:hypothetical protein
MFIKIVFIHRQQCPFLLSEGNHAPERFRLPPGHAANGEWSKPEITSFQIPISKEI